jgi:hypothetical protein
VLQSTLQYGAEDGLDARLSFFGHAYSHYAVATDDTGAILAIASVVAYQGKHWLHWLESFQPGRGAGRALLSWAEGLGYSLHAKATPGAQGFYQRFASTLRTAA